MSEANAINANTAGIVGNSGSSFTGTSVSQYNVILGGSNSYTLSQSAPSSTTGVPLISQGSSSNPIFGTALVAGGGTGATSFNTNGVIISGSSGTSPLAALTLTAGQLLIGGNAAPAAGTITAGSGISISNGNNSITISSTGAGFAWTDVTGASQTLAAQNGYIADSSSLITFTLPTNNSLGDTIQIVGKGLGLWKIVYGTGQNIIFGTLPSTITTGNIASTNAADCVTLVCTTASASAPIFSVMNSVGNITVA